MTMTDGPRLKPYSKLRGLWREYGYRQSDIAQILGCSTEYINSAVNNKTAWRLDYCYYLLKWFRLPPEALTDYFPPKGGSQNVNA